MSSTDQDTGPAPFRLPELPPEMRRLILKEMTRIDGVSLTTLATVCREWAWIVEPVNWARIRVRERDLASLGYMTRRTWPMIRHVWFCIELDEYSCEYCDATIQAALPRQDGAHVHHTAHGSVIAALEGLWAGLSTWGEEGRVMLDLSIYSPSDSDHEYKYLTTLPDAPGEGFRDGRCTIDHVRPPPGVSDRGSWNAPFVPLPWYYPGEAQAPADHGWLSGRRVLPGSAWRLRRQFPLIDGLELPGDLDGDDGGDLLTDITERLPPVLAVKGVMLRQQDRRVWFPVLLGGPFARLPKLEELHYEPWRRYDRAEQRHEDDMYMSLLDAMADSNPHLKKLVVFENFCDKDVFIMTWRRELTIDLVRLPTPALSRRLTRASLGLEHFAASFLVDAAQIFPGDPAWEWPNLRSMAVTSRLFLWPRGNDDHAARIQVLLRDAAAAVARMPRLQSLDIWNGNIRQAAAFKYRADHGRGCASITWTGTWGPGLPKETKDAWREVAFDHGCRRFEVKCRRLDMSHIKSHGDAIDQLGLGSEVIRAISLRQIQMETKMV